MITLIIVKGVLTMTNRKIQELQMNDFAFKPSLTAPIQVEEPIKRTLDNPTIEKASAIVFKQMELEGLRPKTLVSYKKALRLFVEHSRVQFVEDINKDNLTKWIHENENQASTKANRLRFISAILKRFYANDWIAYQFWKDIKVKISKKQQQPATENELEILLSLIDTSTFIGFRDVCILLVLYRTGIRVNTLVEMREEHIDFANKELALSADIMKNHKNLRLPLDDELLELLARLIKQNQIVRKRYKQNNKLVFITKNGTSCQSPNSNNNSVSKRIHFYASKYGLNISPHKIRRLYANNLLKKKANISVISAALGHSSLVVTEKYLSLTEREVSDELRKYL